MTMNFPAPATPGQIYSPPGGPVYRYDSPVWNAVTAAPTSASQVTITDGVTAPSTAAGLAQIYVDTADGDLKIRFGDGTTKTIVMDT
jgi:hypothetical protein